jgi:hypothetical protein
MPGATNYPQTLAVAQAIVAFCTALTNPATNTPIYAQISLGENKDITTAVANGNACLEVYGNSDDSQHKAFGGKITDEQTWFLLSLVSLDDAQAAEKQIYQVRDAVIQPFQTHATLGNAGSVYHSQIKPKSGKFFKVLRNGQWLRSHVFEVLTRSEWIVTTPPGVIA